MPSSELTSSPRVLRIPRSDELQTHVLAHVSHIGSTSWNIAATEGEHPYVGSVNQASLKKLRAKNYQGSDDEWAEILSYVLGQLPATPSNQNWASDIETSASISGSNGEDKTMVITVRKRIHKITQRLGSIMLKQDDEQSLEVFDWCDIAVARADSLENQVTSLYSRHRVAENTINKLNRQLEDFIRLRDQDHNHLVANFARLLNEKKLKIRNQQRLLAAAKVDSAKVSEADIADAESSLSSTKRNRHSKRTAREMNADEPGSEAEFEDMEIDNSRDGNIPEDNNEADGAEQSTSQASEEEDGTTPDKEPSVPQIKGREGTIELESASRRRKASDGSPPRRELPFTRKTRGGQDTETQVPRAKNNLADTAGETDDDDDDDDDEL